MKTVKSIIQILLLQSMLLALAACSGPGNRPDANEQAGALQSSSPVLATVDGEEITQADVDFMIERTFSNADQLFFDETMQSKVLDSLIAARSMKNVISSELSSEEIAKIERKIRAYGEELYVKEYLVRNATPEPVSTQMVNEYYQSHPQEFGGGESKVFELLKTASQPQEQQRDSILASVSELRQTANWSGFAESSANDLGLSYFQSKMQPGLLEPELERAVQNLAVNQVSDVVFVKGVPHILRVTAVEQLAAKPLASVSAGIRKKLAALQLKKAVKKASEEVVQLSSVTLVEQ